MEGPEGEADAVVQDGSDPELPVRKRFWRRRAFKIAASSVAVLLVLIIGGGTYVYFRLNGNVSGVPVTEELGPDKDRPRDFPGVISVLLIGTDSREGLGARYGDAGSVGHADTTLLVQVAADRQSTSVVSIPRDLMVALPECRTDKGKTIPGSDRAMFNVSLGQDGRGPGCVMKTVEKLTGVRVDHFVMVDFEAVKSITTALGGVEVCTTKQIDDVKSGLHLSPGKHRVFGETALAFVRTRHGVGFGSDLDRIKLQQQFLSSMIRSIKSAGTLSNPVRAVTVADKVTKALTVDEDIASIRSLAGLALDLNKVDSANITFATVPVLDSTLPYEEGRLVLEEPAADDLFARVAAVEPLQASKGAKASTKPGAGPTAIPGVTTQRASKATCAS
jgi:LCP family protein required for cell wall assembly